MRQLIKQYWPIPATYILWVIVFAAFQHLPMESTGDVISIGLLYFLIVTPVTAAILCFYYGYKDENKYKWGLPVLCGIAEIVILATSSRSLDPYLILLGIITAIPALAGMVLGIIVKKTVTRNKQSKAQKADINIQGSDAMIEK